MTSDIHDDAVLIVDFGSQYSQLIARRVRELGVFSEICAWDNDGVDPAFLRRFKGIVLSGGPESTTLESAPFISDAMLDSGLPLLGICYGMQTLAKQLGGAVECSDVHEFGYARICVEGENRLLTGISDHHEEGRDYLDVWMSHGDRVSEMPEGYELIASTESCPIAGFADEKNRRYGIQFHPEVTHTLQGARILEHFVRGVCGCGESWTPAQIVSDAVEKIRHQVGSDHVILGLSGGVDSSVTAALLAKAIGNQLTCVFVDNGLLRKDEATQVIAMFGDDMGLTIRQIDAEELFLGKLEGVSDPELKRKVIGNTFIEVFDEAANSIDDANWLAQGTIYPDVIESAASATGKAHVIKSHHNVGGLPEDMQLKLLEPLRELFKDEVRKVGLELGLPYDMVYRHPFPGPGLGVRILGEVKKEYADLLREADAIFIGELRAAGLYNKVSQAFTVFLPVRSVGVVGDARRYAHVVSLRAVETIDFMTARAAHLPHEFLDRVASRIINEIPGISRVTLDISSKPPATIEWE
jgi:GMP synthase (glutamine-hydrolysing)